jgi:acyl-coenzyme A thioesterase PaaI-like protein
VTPPQSTGERLLRLWRRLAPIPGGRWLFALILGRAVPYSGSVSPRIEVLEPGHARVSIRQRRRLEQHLGSIHAIALANAGELASGLALNAALPPGARGIVTAFRMEYRKKARGTITADCRLAARAREAITAVAQEHVTKVAPVHVSAVVTAEAQRGAEDGHTAREMELVTELTDEGGHVVARATATWLIR